MEVGGLAVESAQIAGPESGIRCPPRAVLSWACPGAGLAVSMRWSQTLLLPVRISCASGLPAQPGKDLPGGTFNPKELWSQVLLEGSAALGALGAYEPGIQLHWLQLVLSEQHHMDRSCWDLLTSTNNCHLRFILILVNVRSFILLYEASSY